MVNWSLLLSVFLLGYCIRGIVNAFERAKKCENAEKEFLDAHPLCIVCEREGRYRKATKVWVETNGNWQARCDEHYEASELL